MNGPAAAPTPPPSRRPPPVSPPPTVRVWSLYVRLSHWALAGCVLVCLVQHHGGPWHERLGYAALVLALARVAHGFITRDRFARFANFVRGPRATLAHLQALATQPEARFLGHNPLGGWMIVALLALALLAGGTGALYVTDRFWGDDLVARVHGLLGWGFALLVPLHLMGVVFSSLMQGENLAGAMLSGRKPGGPAADDAAGDAAQAEHASAAARGGPLA